MSATMQLRLAGDQALQRKVGAIVAGFEDTEPLAEILGVYLESSTLERFENETAPDGTPWEQSIRKREEGGKTLTDSAQLKGSIHSDPSKGQVLWGSNKIYARTHQDGATIKAKGGGRLAFNLPGDLGFRTMEQVTIPARPFLGINAEDEIELVALTEDYAEGLEGQA